jgi:hypothetical protein
MPRVLQRVPAHIVLSLIGDAWMVQHKMGGWSKGPEPSRVSSIGFLVSSRCLSARTLLLLPLATSRAHFNTWTSIRESKSLAMKQALQRKFAALNGQPMQQQTARHMLIYSTC